MVQNQLLAKIWVELHPYHELSKLLLIHIAPHQALVMNLVGSDKNDTSKFCVRQTK